MYIKPLPYKPSYRFEMILISDIRRPFYRLRNAEDVVRHLNDEF